MSKMTREALLLAIILIIEYGFLSRIGAGSQPRFQQGLILILLTASIGAAVILRRAPTKPRRILQSALGLILGIIVFAAACSVFNACGLMNRSLGPIPAGVSYILVSTIGAVIGVVIVLILRRVTDKPA